MKRTIIKKSQLKELITEVIKELNVKDYITSADDAGDDSISGPGVSLAKDKSSFIYFTMPYGRHFSEFSDNTSGQVSVAKVKSVTRGFVDGNESSPFLDVEVTSTTTSPRRPRELGEPEDVTLRVYANSAGVHHPTLLIHNVTRYYNLRVVFYNEDDAKKFIRGALSKANADDKELMKNGIPRSEQPPMAKPSSLQYIPRGASKDATRVYNAIKAIGQESISTSSSNTASVAQAQASV